MAYVKNTWVDQKVQRPKTYNFTTNDDGSTTLIDAFGNVEELGTPVNADNMNHIEDGLTNVGIWTYSDTITYDKDDAVIGIVDDNFVLYRSLKNGNKGNALTNTEFWQVENFGGGSSGNNLFDVLYTDHILSGDEAKGKAQTGTYVYKEAIAGSREGYPDFYNECVKQYNEAKASGNLQVINLNIKETSAPRHEPNGVIYTTPYNGYFSTPNSITFGANPWEIRFYFKFYALPTADTAFAGWVTGITPAGSAGINFYYQNSTQHLVVELSTGATKLDIGSLATKNALVAQVGYNVRVVYTGEKYQMYLATDESDEVLQSEIASSVTVNSGSGVFNFGADAVNGQCQGRVTWRPQLSWIKSNGVTVWSALNGYKHDNGHVFYDIANKELVDQTLTDTGSAWYYGVDTANERIFLPRRDLSYVQANKALKVFGDGNALAFDTGETGLNYLSTNNSYNNSKPQYLSNANTGKVARLGSVSITQNTAHGGSNTAGGIANWSRTTYFGTTSGLTTETTQVDNFKYTYIVVGNTEQVSAVTDVVDVTTTENDTMPLFTGQYFDFKPNNVSWLKGGEQKNNAGIYAFAYSELVNELTTPKYGLKVIDVANKVDNTDYSEYWQIDQDAMTFQTPTKISYKPLNGKIKGDGNTLGLTDGTHNGGLGTVNVSGSPAGIGAQAFGIAVQSTGRIDTRFEAGYYGVTPDSDKSGIIAEEATTQLYFKVANAVQNLEVLDAGEVLESLADKIGRQDCKAYVTETYVNGTSWYRIYSDGWCEQGGYASNSDSTGTGQRTITLLKSYKDTNYSAIVTWTNAGTQSPATAWTGSLKSKAVGSFVINKDNKTYVTNYTWRASGYIS